MESTKRTLPPNPREHSNILSILIFTWTIPLFRKGCAKILELEDIFQPLNADKSDSLGDRIQISWKNQLNKSKRPSLLAAIFKTFWKELTFYAFVCFFNELVARLGQPLILGQLLLYFRTGSTMTYNDAMYYACGLLFFNAVLSLSTNQFYMLGFHIGMKVRVAICSLIYRKAICLSQTALGETSPGKVVNLLSVKE